MLIFLHDVNECLSFRNIQKNWQNLFWILTYKLLFAKNRIFMQFRRRQVEAAANNFRRFEKSNLKGH
jgi:hypothetical protein